MAGALTVINTAAIITVYSRNWAATDTKSCDLIITRHCWLDSPRQIHDRRMEKNQFAFTPSWNPPPKYKDLYVVYKI